jgi:hypothetical protein
MAGTWSNLTTSTTFNVDTMLLLTNGSVMAHETSSEKWHKLVPDSDGNYETGTWKDLQSLPNNSIITAAQGGPSNQPLYFASAVFADGRVFVGGGEYNGSVSGADIAACQIYDPVTDSWQIITPPAGWANIGDSASCILPDGRMMIAQYNSSAVAIYDPKRDLWTFAANKGDAGSEETLTLLPDGTILTVQCSNGNNAEKYVISSDQWVSAGSTPSTLPQACPGLVAEIGPAILLPNGKVFAIGATGNSAIYTPPTVITDPGTWAAGPTFMDSGGNTSFPMDAPAVLLPNGKVLLVGSPTPPCSYPGPTTFFEYDPSTNLATVISSSGNASGPAYTGRMLLLPTGQVLYSNGSTNLQIYTPDGTPQATWKPAITAFTSVMTTGHHYTLSGTQFNGLSQACSYGDDAQMATNYPIVRVTNSLSGKITYLRTSDHSSMGVATGATVVDTTIHIPDDLLPGPYSMVVVANGIASDSVNITISLQDSFIIVDRSSIGEGEVQALINESGTPAHIDHVLYVVVEGFTPADLGITAANLNSPPRIPSIPNPAGMISLQFQGPVLPQDPSLQPVPQRFTFPYKIVFQDASVFNFGGQSEDMSISASIASISGTVVSAGAIITLLKNPNPFILHGDIAAGFEWYVSTDVRVFQMKANQTKFAAHVAETGNARDVALNFITQAINNLNSSPGSADTEFNLLPQAEQASELALAPADASGVPVYNFAIARVRFRDIVQADDVRVFFRMWPAQQTNATYDTTTTYRRTTNPTGEQIPLLGIQGDEIITIPFFASPRVNSDLVGMATQTDGPNVRAHIVPDGLGGEVHAYFGCWLDINQPTELLFPSRMTGPNVGTMPDGPFNGTGQKFPIQQLVRSEHQCLLTEISFDLATIPGSADPSTSDKLAQRNLTFVNVPNPGALQSRRAPQTFEIRPTPYYLPANLPHDELLIDWGNTPKGTIASVYLPAVSADHILELAAQTYPTHRLIKIDPYTIQCLAEGITYIPIAKGQTINFAGLLTVDLPLGITKGQEFNITVKQITVTGRSNVAYKGRTEKILSTKELNSKGTPEFIWRKVLGVFHLNIPVSTKALLLESEARRLSILRWIELAIPVESRWYLVFRRYVDQIADRVTFMGGDPTTIEPSGTGDGKKGRITNDGDHNECISCRIQKIIYFLIFVLLIIILGVLLFKG